METSELQTASGLHRPSPMKRVAVAILAMLFVTGCGVGADESFDGQNLVTSSSQALETAPEFEPALPGPSGTQTPETTAPSPLRDPGTVALPQDPIPVYEGRPVGAPAPLVEPLLGPAPRPGIR